MIPSTSNLKLVKQVKSAKGGWMRRYSHESKATNCVMTFSIFLPETSSPASTTTATDIPPLSSQSSESSASIASTNQPSSNTKKLVPVLYYLPGLTCNDELPMIKSGLQTYAAERGIAVVATDTSPRGVGIEGEDDNWDFGSAAGFYLDATEPNWNGYYNMYSYITEELPSIIAANFPVIEGCQSIMGHSMGGHGALVIAIKNSDKYKSVSAFAPICHPMQCPWGIKAFTGYLGSDQGLWKEYDATMLIRERGPIPLEILIDQGTDDEFLQNKQLLPEALQAACEEVDQKIKLRMQEGYDHSYYFISSFIEDHINHHADALLDGN